MAGKKRSHQQDSSDDETSKAKKKKLEEFGPSSHKLKKTGGELGKSDAKPQIKDKLASMIFDEEDISGASVKKETTAKPSVHPVSVPLSKKDRFNVKPLSAPTKPVENRPPHPTTLPKKQIPATPVNPSTSNPALQSSASSSAGTPVPASPFKKKPKKKNLFGISGYQRAGDDFRPEDTPLPENADSTTSSAIDLFANTSSSTIPLKPETTTTTTSQTIEPPNLKTQKLQQHRTLFSLPLFKVNLLPLPPATSAAHRELPKKAFGRPISTSPPKPSPYFIDLQVALYLGKQSGRQVLDLFPNLTSRVATRAQKEQLSASPLSESCFDAIMEGKRKQEGPDAKIPRWMQWSDRADGKRGLRFEELDVQFLAAEEVVKALKGWKRKDAGGGGAGVGLEDLFNEDVNKMEGVDGEDDGDDGFSFVESLDVVELDLDKFVGCGSSMPSMVGTGSIPVKVPK
ncbi:hypothetical protein BDR26DRAFT_519244 [Obelidium mucronatum]|nr:hypothetical protein BDR26DRAFT_519244 [Obelidium mucronatum]